MFNIKKIAATAVMALVIGGGLIGGSMEASAYDGIRCEDDECLRPSKVTTYEGSNLIYKMNEPVDSGYIWR